jgi:hypothetical protein
MFFSTEVSVDTQATVVILLTPRDPAYINEQHRDELDAFIAMRRAFIEALRGSEEDMARFHERYPGAMEIPPNRYGSHIFMLEHSENYRRFYGEQLTADDLKFGVLREGMDLD